MPLALGKLGRRERQIMDVVIRRGRATAAEVLADLPDPPSYSAVRAMLKLLESKGFVRHVWDGPRHQYLPTEDPEKLRNSAVRHLVQTFFDGSVESAVTAMLGSAGPSSEEELARLEELIQSARKKQRAKKGKARS